MYRFILLFFILGQAHFVVAQQHRVVVKDLSGQFKLFSDGAYVNPDSVSLESNTIYIGVDAAEFKGDFLEFENAQPLVLFINGQLAANLEAGKRKFNLDSLSSIYTSELTLAIHHQQKARPDCAVKIIAFVSAVRADDDLAERNRNRFHDFSIIAFGVLMTCFVLLYRSNPQLLFDYLNFIKLFSGQEREENVLSTKIVASGNLLFYGIGSMLLSFLLLAINFYARGSWSWLQVNDYYSVTRLLFSWVSLSVFIFALLILKSLIVFSFSRLFDFAEAATIQFFNFIRLVFMISLLIGVLLIIYFVFGVAAKQSFMRLFDVMSWVLAFWIPIVFLKLLKRSPYSTFHLFSYLCATEIFPVVIVVKLLFL